MAATEPPAALGVNDEVLVVDEGDNDGGDVHSIGPWHSIRSRFSSERAKTLFERYGIKYEEGDRELPDGSQRVEKAIRIRIHWECHECQTNFTGRKTCAKCGHKRCPDCLRSPAKRVKEVLGGTAVMEEIEEKAAKAPEDTDSVVVPVALGSDASREAPAEPPEINNVDKAAGDETLPEFQAEGTLEKDEAGEDGEVDVTQYEYSMQHRPRQGIQLVLRPKSRYIRRTCHECQTNFTPKSRRKCLSCGHDRCEQCPSDASQSDWSDEPASKPGEQQMVGTVERVYRKARQRIRWTCHECKTTFIGRADCVNCGHKRCEACTRSP